MSLGRFQIGDRPVVTATFEDIAGGPVVSSAVTFTIRRPDGVKLIYTETDSEVDAADPNVWELTLPILDRKGKWWVRAESTAGIQDAKEDYFFVERSYALAP